MAYRVLTVIVGSHSGMSVIYLKSGLVECRKILKINVFSYNLLILFAQVKIDPGK